MTVASVGLHRTASPRLSDTTFIEGVRLSICDSRSSATFQAACYLVTIKRDLRESLHKVQTAPIQQVHCYNLVRGRGYPGIHASNPAHYRLHQKLAFGMAEAFGVAAGIFGVVSLSIQLAESVQKVKGFYANVRNAPPKLADLADEIGEMSDLIRELEQQNQPVGFVASPLMQRCIESSRKAVDYFAIFSSELEARVTTRRLRGGIRFALSQDEISRILSRMERAKTLLVLAYMQYQTASQQQQHDHLVLMVQSLASSQDAVLELVKPAAQNVNSQSAGAVPPTHRRKATQARKMFRICTPGWLSNTVWQIALNRSISGWEFTMHTYGVVADNAPIL